jgi:hypothetical protein
MSTCSNTAMLRSICALIIAVVSAYTTISTAFLFPRASMLLALYKWANSYLYIASPLNFTSRTAVLLTFTLAIINRTAEHYESHIQQRIVLNTFLSFLQIIHIIIMPLSALRFCNIYISAYYRQVIVAIKDANVANTLRIILFAKLCSVATAVNMTGLPLWASSHGAAHFPTFNQSMGAFLTIQLGCAYFQVINPSDLPSAYDETIVGNPTSADFERIMTMAYAYLTMGCDFKILHTLQSRK